MFWLRNKKDSILVCTLNYRPGNEKPDEISIGEKFSNFKQQNLNLIMVNLDIFCLRSQLIRIHTASIQLVNASYM